eukprot:15048435-Alexandrium_andersonii.AAC.1
MQKCCGKAQGPDGWRAEELCTLPRPIWSSLVDLFRIFEEWGWPRSLTFWRQTHIPKTETDTPPVGKLRPIAIASVCVRAWNRLRAGQVVRWIAPIAPRFMAGGFPNRTVEQ